jgi:hypothetical protein
MGKGMIVPPQWTCRVIRVLPITPKHETTWKTQDRKETRNAPNGKTTYTAAFNKHSTKSQKHAGLRLNQNEQGKIRIKWNELQQQRKALFHAFVCFVVHY